MKMVEVTIEGVSPYMQSKMHDAPKLEKETHADYEVRTWREKCTVDDSGEICIPAMALKQSLDRAAKMISMGIPGKGKATYTKHFVAGVLCESDVPIGTRKESVDGITINVNSDGVRGSGKRVKRTFPISPKWAGKARFVIFDDTITKSVFEKHMTEAGRFVGVGSFRPENGGTNGRFNVTGFDWSEI